MSLRTLALLCLATFSANAADVVAWKTPLETLASDGKETPGLSRCEPPEPSPFFSPDDELWDLRAVSPEEVDWLVWNATTGRVVAKAGAEQMWRIHHRIGYDKPPLQCRLRFRLLAAPADGGEPAPDAEALAEVSLVTRSGGEFSGTQGSAGNFISASGTANWHHQDLLPALKLTLTGHAGPQRPLEIETRILLQPETTLWLARDFDGTRGLDFTATATLQLPDGSPARNAVERAVGGKAMPVVPAEVPRQRHDLPEGGVLSIYPFGLGALRIHAGDETDPTFDPLAATESDASKILSNFKAVEPPAEIRRWVDHPLLDIRGVFDRPEAKADFAGFDPLTGALVLIPPDVGTADRLLAMTGPESPALVVTEFTGGNGSQSRLVTRSATRARLSHGPDKPDSRHRTFTIEPVLGVPTSLVDLRLDYHEDSGTGATSSFQGSLTLAAGTPLEVIAPTTGSGDVKVKASKLSLQKR